MREHAYPKIQPPHWRWIPMMVTSVPVCWKHHLPEDLCLLHHMLLRRSWITDFKFVVVESVIYNLTISVTTTCYSPGRAPVIGFPDHCPMDYWIWEPGICWWCQTTASTPLGGIVLVVLKCVIQIMFMRQELPSPYVEPSPGLARATLSFEGMEPTTWLDLLYVKKKHLLCTWWML